MNFRNRLNLAFQAISTFIRGIFSRFFTFCGAKPFELIGAIGVVASLYYSQQSLDKTVDAINQSDAQFQDNNVSQEEQDKRSREQHDSLMSVMKQQKTLLDLQLVSLKQQNEIVTRNLGVSKTQLKLAEEIQRREIEGGRCVLIIEGELEIKDTSLKIADLFWHPIIFTTIANKGKRACLSYKIEQTAISNNWELLIPTSAIVGANPINSEQSVVQRAQTLLTNNKEFYYYIRLTYRDIVSNKEYFIEYFFHYKSVRGEYKFFYAQGEEITKMKKVLEERK
jgi:hypothetical protein